MIMYLWKIMEINSNNKDILIEEIKEAVRNLKLIKEGKLKVQTLEELLAELI